MVLQAHVSMQNTMPRSKALRRTCANCCKENDGSFKKCGGCKTVAYCSKDCQKSGWPLHKGECAKFKDLKKNGVQAGKHNWMLFDVDFLPVEWEREHPDIPGDAVHIVYNEDATVVRAICIGQDVSEEETIKVIDMMMDIPSTVLLT